MKILTVRLPETLVADIEEESQARKVSRSDVVRERLEFSAGPGHSRRARLDSITDLVGSVEGLPDDLSAKRKAHLRAFGYGRKRTR